MTLISLLVLEGLPTSWSPRVQEQAPADEEVTESVRRLWDGAADALPRLGVALGIIVVGYLLSRIVRWVMRQLLSRRRTPSFATVMSKVAGWLFLLAAVLGAITVTFPSVRPVDLLAGLGFFSVAVGFAFQDILENTLAGILLLFRQPFQSGDQIEVEKQIGTVEAITIRETRLITFDGQLVIIPNRDVYKNVIRVQTHRERRRLDVTVGVAYENDAREATRVITAALGDVDGVAEDPPPEALVTELGASTVDIEGRCWVLSRQHDYLAVRDEAIVAVKAALDDAGIEMPSDIIALQATTSFRAALQGDAEVTPGGGVRPGAPPASEE